MCVCFYICGATVAALDVACDRCVRDVGVGVGVGVGADVWVFLVLMLVVSVGVGPC